MPAEAVGGIDSALRETVSEARLRAQRCAAADLQCLLPLDRADLLRGRDDVIGLLRRHEQNAVVVADTTSSSVTTCDPTHADCSASGSRSSSCTGPSVKVP
jgi:hypothetical protein